MRKILAWLTLCFLVALSRIGSPAAVPANLADLLRDSQHPPDDARIMVRWWWFGPSVEKPELEREMRLMKEGGMGGFEVQPVYPLELDNPATGVHNFPYLSDEFLEDLRFAGAKAKELGLRFDLRGMTPDLGNLSAMWRNHGLTVLEQLLSDRALKCDGGSLCDQRGGACPACIMAPEVACIAGNNLLSRAALGGGVPPGWDANRNPLVGYFRLETTKVKAA